MNTPLPIISGAGPQRAEADGLAVNTNLAKLAVRASQLTLLPPSFELIPRLLLLLDEADSDNESLAEIIKMDAGLTADVLQISNTAAMGGMRQVQTLDEAIMRIGLRGLYRSVMKVVASPVLNDDQQAGFAALDLWRHSVACALAAQKIASDTGRADPEVAFTAGLLHDIGKVALGQALGAAYIVLFEESKAGAVPLFATEQRRMRANHASIGGALLVAWKFPPSIIAAVAHHHEPTRSNEAHRSLTALVHAANIIAHRIHGAYFLPGYASTPDTPFLALAGLEVAQLPEYESEVKLQFEREEQRFR